MAKKPVQEPYRTANARWYEDALQDFWHNNEKASVIDTGNEDYARNNVGGGKTRGENAHNIIKTGTVTIRNIKCTNALMGDCTWFFEVVSQGSKGSPEKFKPTLTLKHSQEKNRVYLGQNHTVATDGKVVAWKCQCSDFKYRKSVCKHILASTLAMWSRVQKVQGGKLG
jgi:hypothetical protein